MHHGFEKDYRFLLSELIPSHLLSSMRIEGIRNALASGIRAELIRETWLAMDELVSLRIYDRGRPDYRGDEVHVDFSERSGPSRITLEMPVAEYNAVSKAEVPQGGLVPSVLAGIISALTLDDSPVNVSDRLENLLDLAGTLEPGGFVFLMLFSEFDAPNVRKSGRIGESSLASAESGGFYGAYLTSQEPVMLLERGRMEGGIFPVDEKIGRIMLIPLRSAGIVYGFLEVHAISRGNPDSGRMLNYHLVTKGIVKVLDNNRHLERMVSIDRLTGVNNRNNYELQLPLEMERATRNRKCLAFLVMDIDDFKSFNDQYGHDIGDQALVHLAATLKAGLREVDVVGRLGGEEFAALLPDTPLEAAESTALRLCKAVAEASFETPDAGLIKLTVSIGVACTVAEKSGAKDLLKRADIAMYRAKELGRDTIAVDGEE